MNMFLIFDIVFVILGVCMIVSAVNMKQTGKISDWLLTEDELKKCKKPAEFIAYISPWMIGMGAVVCVLGASGILCETDVFTIPYWRYIVMVVFMLVVGVFLTRLSHARIEFS